MQSSKHEEETANEIRVKTGEKQTVERVSLPWYVNDIQKS